MSVICVVGLGYIGLPVAAMLASRDHQVVGYDISESTVNSINGGRSHFFEPDLDMLLSAAVSIGRLKAQSVPCAADYFIIAVPTPVDGGGSRPDLSHVEAAAASIAPCLKSGATVIIESTVPVGTTENVRDQLAALRPDLNFPHYNEDALRSDVGVAHCPERILPGRMLRELTTNDRIIGGMTNDCAAAAKALYDSFVTANCFLTDCRTAELVKLAENSYRDVNIAFANELSLICERLDVDVWKTIELANRHPRVSILRPGAGVGGHCIAVDPWFIVDSAPDEARLIRLAREVNDTKPRRIHEQIVRNASRFKSPVIGCFGLAYKPDVGDLRGSPALDIVTALAKQDGFRILVCEPMIDSLPAELSGLSNVSLAGIDDAIARSDIVAFLVGHRAFQHLSPAQLADKVVVDAIGLMSQPAISRGRIQPGMNSE